MPKKDYLTTRISLIEPGKINIRGYELTELMGAISFGDMIYLLFSGDLPAKNEGKMIEAILVCGAEHGLATPSTNATRLQMGRGELYGRMRKNDQGECIDGHGYE